MPATGRELFDIRINGADAGELARLSRELKKVDKELKNKLRRNINTGTKATRLRIKAAWLSELPSGGGLNKVVARSSLTTSFKDMGKSVGVKIVGKGKVDIRKINTGKVRHPLYANRRFWYTTEVKPKIFENTAEKDKDDLKRSIEQAMREVLDDLRAIT